MYDLAILGGGPAGYAAAFEAVKLHMSVVLFENTELGGTCLNCGCVPTKFLLHKARLYAEVMKEYGGEPDYSRMIVQMKTLIAVQREDLKKRLMGNNVTIINNSARIRDRGLLSCGDDLIEAENILIATGSVPARPVITSGISSENLLFCDKLPKHLHIIGGGTSAVEFAEIFRMLGTEVELSIRSDRILRGWDREISKGITAGMKKKGIVIHTNCDFSQFNTNADAVILNANGRVPCLPDAEKDLFDSGADGGIRTDADGQTRTKGIYAAGDVTEGSPRLAHVAMEQGRRAVWNMAGKKTGGNRTLVRCIYPGQEAASVGLTETEALQQGIRVVSAKQGMYANARTLISGGERGFIRILADQKKGCIIGAHLLCERAGDMVSELALAVELQLSASDLLKVIRPHPSYCEEISEALRILEDKLSGV